MITVPPCQRMTERDAVGEERKRAQREEEEEEVVGRMRKRRVGASPF